ncbi:hypothetical protein O9929_23290 [Vibrio lentus]|nr:hypothetical protein [Vibrio lentus]
MAPLTAMLDERQKKLVDTYLRHSENAAKELELAKSSRRITPSQMRKKCVFELIEQGKKRRNEIITLAHQEA